ncbi:molybdopterin-guanine dinucleotide biosynthesis protein MobB [Effusibacillus consociatus]|uniref:Molybdopterin-guanine dinucleotide biosynthesis protein MobB n=1 Tax=Effusibacillus consociatus TaxID=1117041 RepID=A0ABV9Q6F4_9BACL
MQKGAVLWFTGHSKSGKTALTRLLSDELQQRGYRVARLDSDTLPEAIIKPQADTWEERQRLKYENLSFLSRLLYEYETVVLIASVGRFRQLRERLREQIPDYLEIYLNCPLDIRLQRDVQGKYQTHSDYFHFYEEPERPDILLETGQMSPEECVRLILQHLKDRGYIH